MFDLDGIRKFEKVLETLTVEPELCVVGVTLALLAALLGSAFEVRGCLLRLDCEDFGA